MGNYLILALEGKMKKTNLLIACAVAGLMMGSQAAMADQHEGEAEGKNGCQGKNSCKGHKKEGKNSCKSHKKEGKNSCKSSKKTDGANACSGANGCGGKSN
jgi:hypothetical protein